MLKTTPLRATSLRATSFRNKSDYQIPFLIQRADVRSRFCYQQFNPAGEFMQAIKMNTQMKKGHALNNHVTQTDLNLTSPHMPILPLQYAICDVHYIM